MPPVKDPETSTPAWLPVQPVRAWCQRWSVAEFAVFGSAISGPYGDARDVDVLVSFLPEASWSLFDHVRMRDELAGVFGKPVDLLTRRAVEASRNPYRRRAILDTAQVLDVA